MKQLLSLMTVLFSFNLIGMSTLLQPAKRIASRRAQPPLNYSRNFGKTHFIRGYKTSANLPVESLKTPQITINEKPFIIDDSSIHLIDETRQIQPFFSSIHDITSIIINNIEQAKESVQLAAFSLTHPAITNALIAAHKRGVKVIVFVDAGNRKQFHSKANKLIDNGIAVWSYDPTKKENYHQNKPYESLMHAKCVLTDNCVITGSANFTKAAQKSNIENIIIVRDLQTVEEYRREMARLQKMCVECKIH